MSDPYRRLYRSRKDKVIAGVCGGLGGYINMDPVLIRIIWLATVVLGGTGLLAYLIAWILIPESPDGYDPGKVERHTDGVKILGVILIAISLFWLAARFGTHHMVFIPWGWVGPVALVALGVALLIRPAMHRAQDPMMEFQSDSTPPSEPESDSGKTAEETSSDEQKTASSKEEEPLRRSRRDRVLLGVCGGLAKRFNVDATVIRVLWAVGTVIGAGVLLIAYLLMALVIPDEEEL